MNPEDTLNWLNKERAAFDSGSMGKHFRERGCCLAKVSVFFPPKSMIILLNFTPSKLQADLQAPRQSFGSIICILELKRMGLGGIQNKCSIRPSHCGLRKKKKKWQKISTFQTMCWNMMSNVKNAHLLSIRLAVATTALTQTMVLFNVYKPKTCFSHIWAYTVIQSLPLRKALVFLLFAFSSPVCVDNVVTKE